VPCRCASFGRYLTTVAAPGANEFMSALGSGIGAMIGLTFRCVNAAMSSGRVARLF